MNKTLATVLATSMVATSALPALAGGLDDAIIEAPVVVEPAPEPAGVGALGTAGLIAAGLVSAGIIAAIVDDDDDDNDTTTTE